VLPSQVPLQFFTSFCISYSGWFLTPFLHFLLHPTAFLFFPGSSHSHTHHTPSHTPRTWLDTFTSGSFLHHPWLSLHTQLDPHTYYISGLQLLPSWIGSGHIHGSLHTHLYFVHATVHFSFLSTHAHTTHCGSLTWPSCLHTQFLGYSTVPPLDNHTFTFHLVPSSFPFFAFTFSTPPHYTRFLWFLVPFLTGLDSSFASVPRFLHLPFPPPQFPTNSGAL